ncbi:MAG: hypothetical protein KC434_17390, partial [Anaerolineales bacterium]|nr:hypothetical protein [Anaerolineales bacterium]
NFFFHDFAFLGAHPRLKLGNVLLYPAGKMIFFSAGKSDGSTLFPTSLFSLRLNKFIEVQLLANYGVASLRKS